MIIRSVEDKINSWIRSGKNALLISGARQVGKTYTIRHCLEELNADYLELNLLETPEAATLIERSLSVDDLIINISSIVNYSFVPNQSIIFIDEVQQATDVVTRIKFWVDDGRFRFVLSGSLLGIELQNLRSAPVGYLDEIQMYPMDFIEFLQASNVTANVIEHLRDCFNNRTPVGDVVNNKMLEHFRRYLVVGGMPAAVNEYIDSKNIANVNRIQENIIQLYKKDFTKYENKEKRLSIISVYELMPSELLKQNRRFNIADVKKGLKFERIESSFLWLLSAGVVLSVYNTTEPRIALNQNKKNSFLKLYCSDVGLLTSLYGMAMKASVLSDNNKVNLGGVYENAVAQELFTHGFTPYYYNRHSIGELDFVVEENMHIVPIEVKSGKDYKVHSALNKVVKNPEYDVEKAYVLANCDVSINDKIIYMPIYMSMFINDDVDIPILEDIGGIL